MTFNITDFLDNRIQEIFDNLKENNAQFALSLERSSGLLDNIDPVIVNTERNITLTPYDCMDFKEYFDHQFTQAAIMQEELYKQGYLDCMKLLRLLEVIR